MAVFWKVRQDSLLPNFLSPIHIPADTCPDVGNCVTPILLTSLGGATYYPFFDAFAVRIPAGARFGPMGEVSSKDPKNGTDYKVT